MEILFISRVTIRSVFQNPVTNDSFDDYYVYEPLTELLPSEDFSNDTYVRTSWL